MAEATHANLPAWSRRLMAELDAYDRRAESVAKGLGREQLNWKPAAEAWSIGQCLEHLQMTNEFYVPALAGALEGRPPSRVEEIMPGWLGRWFIRKFIEPSAASTRARAPKKITPAKEVELSILGSFLRSNQAVRELVERVRDQDVNGIRFKNPFFPLLRFTAGTGFEMVTKHQSRHLLQAERVRQDAQFPE